MRKNEKGEVMSDVLKKYGSPITPLVYSETPIKQMARALGKGAREAQKKLVFGVAGDNEELCQELSKCSKIKVY